MKLDLREVPFSRRGSYMALSWHEGEFNHRKLEKGLYLRTVRGAAKEPFVARLLPLKNGKQIEFSICAEPSFMMLEEKGSSQMSDRIQMEIVFADTTTVLVHGKGENAGLCLDFMTDAGMFNFIQPVISGNETWYLADCFKNNMRFMLFNQKGNLGLDQKWNVSGAEYGKAVIQAEKGEFLLILEEVRTDWVNRNRFWDIEEEKEKTEKEFAKFYESMPQVPEEYEETRKMAAYVNWSSMVDKGGLLTREAMYMSKNWMCNVWSWDHCFNAIALAEHDPALAWDQFMIMFDHQTDAGRISDSINDSIIIDNYCKPPIHGWALHKIRQRMHLDRAMTEEAYDRLKKWTLWWLNYRDQDQDGLCEYTHGNDSGWDNSTAFQLLPPVTLPDLAAFLIIQIEELADLADDLGRKKEAGVWRKQAAEMLDRMLARLFENNLPVGIQTVTGERVPTRSLILYLPIVLGKRLPEKVRQAMINILESDEFKTEHGLATEAVTSSLYEADGYWRGPIWAPSTILILDGLWECGRKDFVKDMTRRFLRMVSESGCAENFDALTGEGLRDRAYTWTSSIMLIMAEEYLLEKY